MKQAFGNNGVATCPHCLMAYKWTQTDRGKRPINISDGLAHWETCRGFRLSGKRARKSRNKSVGWEPKVRKSAPDNVKITGPYYIPQPSDALPWEDEPISPKVDDLLELGGQA